MVVAFQSTVSALTKKETGQLQDQTKGFRTVHHERASSDRTKSLILDAPLFQESIDMLYHTLVHLHDQLRVRAQLLCTTARLIVPSCKTRLSTFYWTI